nr:MAG TPA: hypothetical protein [Bacteriophage sp.]
MYFCSTKIKNKGRTFKIKSYEKESYYQSD